MRIGFEANKRWNKKKNEIGSGPRTNHGEQPGHICLIHQNNKIGVVDSELHYFNLSFSLSRNLGD